MLRLRVHVEGQTEEGFVNFVLRPHLYSFGFSEISARLLGKARLRSKRGGIKGWDAVRDDLARHLRQDSTCQHTTMVDYYALPQRGERAWPGRAEAALAAVGEKARLVEDGMVSDLRRLLGEKVERFIPFVMMHEFEALLFSDPVTFASAVGEPALAPKLTAIRSAFASPEAINDSPLTAPSKRIEKLLPSYDKVFHGLQVGLAIARAKATHPRRVIESGSVAEASARTIGLPAMRAACLHFDGWLQRLEACGREHLSREQTEQ